MTKIPGSVVRDDLSSGWFEVEVEIARERYT